MLQSGFCWPSRVTSTKNFSILGMYRNFSKFRTRHCHVLKKYHCIFDVYFTNSRPFSEKRTFAVIWNLRHTFLPQSQEYSRATIQMWSDRRLIWNGKSFHCIECCSWHFSSSNFCFFLFSSFHALATSGDHIPTMQNTLVALLVHFAPSPLRL